MLRRLCTALLAVSFCTYSFAAKPPQLVDSQSIELWKWNSQRPMSDEQIRDDIALAKATCASALESTRTEHPALRQLAHILAASTSVESELWHRASQVSPQQVGDFLKSNPERFTTQPTAVLRQIFVSTEDASPAEVEGARKRAETARARLDAGEAFQNVAAELSDATTSRFQGGIVGTVHPDSVSSEVAKTIFSMKAGETRGPIQMKKGFVIFRVDAISHAKSLPREEALKLARTALVEEKAFRYRKDMLSTLTAALHPEARLDDGPTSNSASVVWMKTSSGTTVSATVAYAFLESIGMLPADINRENWKAELLTLRDKVLFAEQARQGDAASQATIDRDTRLMECKLASNSYWEAQRQALQPTVAQLREYQANHRGDFPDSMRFSVALLFVPVGTSSGPLSVSPVERHQQLSTSTKALKSILREANPTSLTQVMPAVQRVFPNAKLTELKDAVTAGYMVDPLAETLRPGTITDPIETRTGLLVVQLIGRKSHAPTFEELRPVLDSRWRDEQIKKKQETLLTR